MGHLTIPLQFVMQFQPKRQGVSPRKAAEMTAKRKPVNSKVLPDRLLF
jgi:hypothetical protein